MTNAKRRRQRKVFTKVRGNAGRPHPHGNRAYRRSSEGKAEIAQYLGKIGLSA